MLGVDAIYQGVLHMRTELSPTQEAEHLLRLFKDSLVDCIGFVQNQFNVIQARSQFLLSLGTLTLTITGFSGPKIAATNLFARLSIAGGIFMVLCSMLMLLLATNRIKWVSQVDEGQPKETLRVIIGYRNKKTSYYQIELMLLVIGLSMYVASVIAYLIFGF
jgi:hypothetical protein